MAHSMRRPKSRAALTLMAQMEEAVEEAAMAKVARPVEATDQAMDVEATKGEVEHHTAAMVAVVAAVV